MLLNSVTFVGKNFPDWDPVFGPVSGFSTSDGHIQKIPTQMNYYLHIISAIKISSWSGVRFFVRFPVFLKIAFF